MSDIKNMVLALDYKPEKKLDEMRYHFAGEIQLFKRHLQELSPRTAIENRKSQLKGTKRPCSPSNTTSEPQIKKAKDNLPKNEGFVQVYTSGSCSGSKRNPKAGIGVWFASNHELNVSMECPTDQTVNSAEIQAAVMACKIAKTNGEKKIEIFTDSRFLRNCMTHWIQRWKKNAWKTLSGKDISLKTDILMLEEESKGLLVQYTYVPQYLDAEGIEEAFKLAHLAIDT